MSKYGVIVGSLILASVGLAGSVYLYRASNQSNASQNNITKTTTPVVTESSGGTEDLGPPSPTDSGTTTEPSAAPSPTPAPSPQGTTAPPPASAPSASPTPASQTSASTSDTSTSSSKSTSSSSQATSATSQSSEPATTTAHSAADIKKSIEAMTLHRTLSSDQSVDAVLIQFSILVPNYPLKMTIASDPIVVQTKSNDSGQVTYRLANTLDAGNHSVTVVLVDPNDATKTITATRAFTLPQIKTSNQLNSSTGISGNQITIPIQYIIALLATIAGASILAFVLYRARERSHVINLEG